MALVVIPEGYFNTRYIWQCSGVLDDMSFAIGGQTGVGMDASDIAEACHLAFFNGVVVSDEQVNAAYTYVGTQTTRTIGGEPQIGEFNNGLTGVKVGDGVIVNSALLIRKSTALGGRKNRGRCFVPCFAEDNSEITAAGLVTPSHVAAIQDRWDSFYSLLGEGFVEPYLLHTDPLDEPTPITRFAVQGLLATQRRRMR